MDPLDSQSCRKCGLFMTDWYFVLTAYSLWKQRKHEQSAVFEAFFRKAPFHGAFAVFAGIGDVIEYINRFHFKPEDLSFLKSQIPYAEDTFFEYLAGIDSRDISVSAVKEGSLIFPKEPVLRITGPLLICQLLEGAILNKINYPSLVATNAARHRLAAGWKPKLFEFGMRRAQGPDGALTASRFAYLGSFDGTSNIAAANIYHIPVSGTMCHSFVSSFSSLNDLAPNLVLGPDFVKSVLECRSSIIDTLGSDLADMLNEGELAAFTAFANDFSDHFLVIVDTYDTIRSGVPNFLSVALALFKMNKQPRGVRIDSGDLAYLSREIRKLFKKCEATYQFPFTNLTIVASNDLNESAIMSLNDEGHEIDAFGIGTNLVTCQSQPALGMVYKLVELDGKPCMKLSDDLEKTTLPHAKEVYRLLSKEGTPMIDLIQAEKSVAPQPGQKLFCQHLYDDKKRCFFVPSRVVRLLEPALLNGKLLKEIEPLSVCRERCISELKCLRQDHLRFQNATPYKVSVSPEYFDIFHRMWKEIAPIRTLE